jgi:hypothetical protein
MSNRPTCKECDKPIDYRTVSGFCNEHRERAGSRTYPVPGDFVEYARHRSAKEICRRYGVSDPVVARWRREAYGASGVRVLWSAEDDAYLRQHYGTSRTADIAVALDRTLLSVRKRVKTLGLRVTRAPAFKQHFSFTRDRKPNVSGRVQSSADMAASHIRAHDRTAVYRCDRDGHPDPKGDHWKYGYGSVVLTEDDLFTKAERKGWQADEWKKLAA